MFACLALFYCLKLRLHHFELNKFDKKRKQSVFGKPPLLHIRCNLSLRRKNSRNCLSMSANKSRLTRHRFTNNLLKLVPQVCFH